MSLERERRVARLAPRRALHAATRRCGSVASTTFFATGAATLAPPRAPPTRCAQPATDRRGLAARRSGGARWRVPASSLWARCSSARAATSALSNSQRSTVAAVAASPCAAARASSSTILEGATPRRSSSDSSVPTVSCAAASAQLRRRLHLELGAATLLSSADVGGRRRELRRNALEARARVRRRASVLIRGALLRGAPPRARVDAPGDVELERRRSTRRGGRLRRRRRRW